MEIAQEKEFLKLPNDNKYIAYALDTDGWAYSNDLDREAAIRSIYNWTFLHSSSDIVYFIHHPESGYIFCTKQIESSIKEHFAKIKEKVELKSGIESLKGISVFDEIKTLYTYKTDDVEISSNLLYMVQQASYGVVVGFPNLWHCTEDQRKIDGRYIVQDNFQTTTTNEHLMSISCKVDGIKELIEKNATELEDSKNTYQVVIDGKEIGVAQKVDFPIVYPLVTNAHRIVELKENSDLKIYGCSMTLLQYKEFEKSQMYDAVKVEIREIDENGNVVGLHKYSGCTIVSSAWGNNFLCMDISVPFIAND